MKIDLIAVASDLGAPRAGARFGPEALRVAGLPARLGGRTRWVNLPVAAGEGTATPGADPAGNIARLASLCGGLARKVAGSLRRGALPLVLGGDHAVAVGTWSGIAGAGRKAGGFGLLWIDAHMDAHTPATTATGNLHGMPLAALLGHGDARLTGIGDAQPKLAPEHVCLVGVRSFEADEAELLRRLGVTVFAMDEIGRRGLEAVMREALAIVAGAPAGFGVSLDVDALDPREAPGVTVPEDNGLGAAELGAALAGIARHPRLRGIEIAEYNPLADHAGQTARVIITLLERMFAKETAMSDFIHTEKARGANNYAPLPVVLTRGEGVHLWDATGKRYLDMMSAYSAVNLGHCHPELVRTLAEQAAQLAVVSRAYYTNRLAPLLERLCALTGLDRALPANTGLEAVETALKAARKWGHKRKGIAENRAEILCCDGNFHGRSIAIVAMSSEAQYKDGFGPFPSGFRRLPYGDAEALEAAIGPHTAAFLVEPIQGEAGIVVPPEGYLRRAAEICRRHGVLFILDEVQTGLGRTGKLFAWQHEGEAARPDAICLGKALGGGLLPVSAFVARQEVMDVFTPGDHGSTFGGNPLAAAVATKALDLIVDGRLAERADELGERFRAGLEAIASPLIREVRGKGLLIGVEIDRRVASARAVAESLMEAGLLTKETHATVLRFAPPLIITAAQVDEALAIIAAVFAEFDSRQRAAA